MSESYPVLPPGPEMIEAMRRLVAVKHAGQFRRDGVTPYISHLTGVADLFHKHWTERSDGWAAYVLLLGQEGYYRGMALSLGHDLIEDTEVKPREFKEAGLSELLPDLLVLSRAENESYLDYILHIKELARGGSNVLPLMVKLCDMEYNLNDKPTKAQKDKYLLARHILLTP